MKTFQELKEELDYSEYLRFLKNIQVTETGAIVISENFISKKYEKAMEFIQDFSIKFQMKVVDLIKIFSEKFLYQVFSAIEWSIKKFIQMLQKGYVLWNDMHDAISEYLASRKLVKLTRENLEDFDDFLDEKHPSIKKVSSLALAGFLIFQWSSLISFTGNVKFDFDQSKLLKAMKGKAGFSEVFFSPSGVKMLLFIGTGVGAGVSFPWGVLGGTWTLFAASIVYTVAVKKYPSVAAKIKKHIQTK